MPNLDWDSVKCGDPECTNDHLRFINRDTGEILSYVHGPDGMGGFHLCDGVGDSIANYIDSTSAMEAAQARYTYLLADAEQRKKLKDFAVAHIDQARFIGGDFEQVKVPIMALGEPIQKDGPPEGY